ncbi:MAG TPA: 4-(cytidine 5'-diphospho)-2-C-methyl-D-erythritol kinase [Casimicrobiaceae bacterium]|jgi:4-diphosphocytidyl-2-C-methyl-D-erythritol kinase
MSPPNTLRLPAPAKLNLFLHVTGRRDDGYHTLESLLVPIDSGDRVTLSERSDSAVVRVRGAVEVAASDDIAVRAARLVQRNCGIQRGVGIDIDKRIPVGGGLGGGSSDAATVLLGLNRMWRLGLSRHALMTMGLELGADVPFFIFGEPAFARGIGEALEAVSLPPTWFLVLAPPVRVATASIFAAPELTRNGASAKMAVFSEGYGRNDLQPVAASRFPEIAACLDALSRETAGAAPIGMSGSGSCVFAAFSAEAAALQALSSMVRAGRAGFVARALNRHPLRCFAAP